MVTEQAGKACQPPRGVSFSLAGRVAVVTGASRGIGKSIAAAFAGAGARVVLVSRKIEGLAETAKEIGEGATPFACHMGRADQIDALFSHARAEFGGLDILVNNAATNPHFGPVLTADASHFDKTFEVNVKGPFLAARAAAPLLQERGGGVIINVASIVGFTPGLMMGVYSVSKAALIMLTLVLAQELAPANVRVNAIAPGFVKTAFSRALWENDAIHQEILKTVPMGRMAEPDEIAGAALFLASDAARYVTGETIVVDGGKLIG
ncbi:MAG: glucose 1-dehydrogenase [Planctomycetes bacterium]|nr:glucose 1-dehydrogenase [Planctomycetota bacterium]